MILGAQRTFSEGVPETKKQTYHLEKNWKNSNPTKISLPGFSAWGALAGAFYVPLLPKKQPFETPGGEMFFLIFNFRT